MTNSEYLSTMLGHEESVSDLLDEFEDGEGLADDVRQIADDVESYGDEQSDKLNNMPDALQQGSTGELLQQRADACSTIAEELRTFADEAASAWADGDKSNDDETEALKQEIRDSYSVSWDLE